MNSLFDGDVGIAHRLARTDGPSTSAAAAQKIAPRVGTDRARAWEALKQLPDCTQRELDDKFCPPPLQRKYGRRMSELVRLGLAEVTGTRNGQMTYRAVETKGA